MIRMRSDNMHKALGNAIRQRILLSLAKKDKYLSEIAGEIHLAPQTADFHLNILAELGIVSSEWHNGKKYYHLKDKRILAFLDEGGRPMPMEFRPKPPHEIVLDAWKDLGKRLDAIDRRLDRIESALESKRHKK